MSIYSPSIVPSFDQMGIACQVIDVRIVRSDPDTGRLIAWGIKKFGVSASGDQIGVPVPRFLYFAFEGLYRDRHLLLESHHCKFELTAFPAPLDRLRFAGSLDPDLAPSIGAAMAAEYQLPGPKKWAAGRRRPQPENVVQLIFIFLSLFPALGGRIKHAWTYMRKWFPRGSGRRNLRPLARMLRLSLPAFWLLTRRKTYGPWGLFDRRGFFSGVGTFKAMPLALEKRTLPAGIQLKSFEYDRQRRRLAATFENQSGHGPRPTVIPGILVFDAEQNRPLRLDYNRLTTISRLPSGHLQRCTLDLPLSVPVAHRSLVGIVLLDVHPVGECSLKRES